MTKNCGECPWTEEAINYDDVWCKIYHGSFDKKSVVCPSRRMFEVMRERIRKDGK